MFLNNKEWKMKNFFLNFFHNKAIIRGTSHQVGERTRNTRECQHRRSLLCKNSRATAVFKVRGFDLDRNYSSTIYRPWNLKPIASMSLGLLICKMGIKTLPAQRGYCWTGCPNVFMYQASAHLLMHSKQPLSGDHQCWYCYITLL